MTSLLNSLDRRLRETLARSGGSQDSLQQLAEELGEPGKAVDLLRAILADSASLREIAKNAYFHPNGYDKIPFVSAPSTEVPYELRMHVWWSHQAYLPTDIHNHDWGFCSRVLCGRLECQEYEVDPRGDPMLRFAYIRSEKGRFELVCQGTESVRQVRCYALLPGQLHALHRSTLHRAAGARDTTTATLLVQGPTSNLSSTIYRDEGFAESRVDSRTGTIEPIGIEALATKLSRIITIIESDRTRELANVEIRE